jgi:hypothetical protein
MQNARLFISALLFMVFTIISFSIAEDDFIADVAIAEVETYVDQLRDIVYKPNSRLENFVGFGLSDSEAAEAEELAKELDEKNRSRLVRIFEDVENTELATDSFCGHSSDIRPRYAVMQFIITTKGDKREPVDMRRLNRIKEQDWIVRLPLLDIYSEFELRKDPQPDSSVMVVAAVLSGSEDLLLAREAPFGRGYDWSWKEVKREFPEVQSQVIQYFAIMHLMVEIAQGSEGICD